MKTMTAIPISELIKKAGSKRKVAQLAGIQNLTSLSEESVLIGDKMYRPSISKADWGEVSKEMVCLEHVTTNPKASDMTLRDHFAGLAMHAYISTDGTMMHNDEDVAIWAYASADAMLKEREHAE